MRNLILASAAAFALAMTAAPTFAAQQGGGNDQQAQQQVQANQSSSSNSESQCANKRANPEQWGASSYELSNCNGGQ
jgi:hypothetical protein